MKVDTPPRSRALTLNVETSFDAAHHLPRHTGKCRNLHGHLWRVVCSFAGEVSDDQQFVVDFGALKALCRELVHDRLDHSLVNDTIPYPTAENISGWIADEITAALELEPWASQGVRLTAVQLWETPNCSVTLHLGR